MKVNNCHEKYASYFYTVWWDFCSSYQPLLFLNPAQKSAILKKSVESDDGLFVFFVQTGLAIDNVLLSYN